MIEKTIEDMLPYAEEVYFHLADPFLNQMIEEVQRKEKFYQKNTKIVPSKKKIIFSKKNQEAQVARYFFGYGMGILFTKGNDLEKNYFGFEEINKKNQDSYFKTINDAFSLYVEKEILTRMNQPYLEKETFGQKMAHQFLKEVLENMKDFRKDFFSSYIEKTENFADIFFPILYDQEVYVLSNLFDSYDHQRYEEDKQIEKKVKIYTNQAIDQYEKMKKSL